MTGGIKIPPVIFMWLPRRLTYYFLLLFFHLREALAAINRPVFPGAERHFRFGAAGSTSRCEHLPVRPRTVFARVTARFAPLGLVDKSSLSVEFLFTGGENKF
jgi:hypothetical protein